MCLPKVLPMSLHPAHPNPLPQGEGATPSVAGATEAASKVRALATILPLPEREGWGEGEERVQSSGSFLSSRSLHPWRLIHLALLLLPLVSGCPAQARINVVTLPERNSVQ